MSNISSVFSISITRPQSFSEPKAESSTDGTKELGDSILHDVRREYMQQGDSVQGSLIETDKLSKNQQKKIKRRQEWETTRHARKARRKEKTKLRKQKKKESATGSPEQARVLKDASCATLQTPSLAGSNSKSIPHRTQAVHAPIAIILDCQFDDLMLEHERVSLAGQITRCYSDNRKASHKVHLAISSFNGNLKARFENVLMRSHESWKGVRFSDEDFVQVAHKMRSYIKNSGERTETHVPEDCKSHSELSDDPEYGEIIYLSSESSNVLREIKSYDTYIVGGLVDHNRHKGICFRKAEERSIKTAKLPIGDFLHMQGRSVLATNHVVEIMLKWLELRDWGQAFMQVIPKRKGTSLK